MAKSAHDPFLELDDTDAVLRAIEKRDDALGYQAFIGNTQMARDRASRMLPDFVDRIARIMSAKVVPMIDKRTGLPVATLPEQDEAGNAVAMDKTQLEFGRILLAKLLPPPVPVERTPAANPLDKGNVHITINQIGGSVDFTQVEGNVEGVLSGEAQRVGKIEIGVADPDDALRGTQPLFKRVRDLSGVKQRPPTFKRDAQDSEDTQKARRNIVIQTTPLDRLIEGGDDDESLYDR